MTIAMDLSERLAEYASSLTYDDLSESVVKEAKKRLLDSVGCAMGAYGEAPAKAARRLAEMVARREITFNQAAERLADSQRRYGGAPGHGER